MNKVMGLQAAGLVWLAALAGPASAHDGPVLQTDDVDLFYRLYDANGGRPGAEQLQRDYLEAGSEGLRHLASVRNVTGVRMVEAIAARPEIYVEARRCADTLPKVRERVDAALKEFARRSPHARFPSVTVAVGRGRPVAIGSPANGVQVGLEALCAATFINPDIEDRFVGVLVHEYVHTQQSAAMTEEQARTVLEISLAEGVAEFLTEVLSGAPAYAYFGPLTEGRELEIETRFAADVDKTELSDWLYNSTMETPGDLGYWVGYRIAKAYYQHAADKDAAFREILELTDAKAFLAASGWRPGIALD
ncbi:DUF2268 domain-containing putative Zn-dependent protease [Brevundimonas sp. BR2-1]|uniref:DUF2268 domain-containing putative Zn-dependent protease n=1 Tax=Brevundimonas sp. BR2-1 TaxID=3031123 RepID=UPI00309BC622